MIDYIVGIDFGHGETAVWVIPTSEGRNPARIDTNEGCALNLKSSNLVNECVIDSEVYFNSSCYLFSYQNAFCWYLQPNENENIRT